MNCLAEDKIIDVKYLRKLAFLGIPDEIQGLRPVVWRILLGYLPENTDEWDSILRSQKESYDVWVEELIAKPKLQEQK